MDIRFGNLSQLNWLWLVAFCIVITVLAAIWRRRARRQFATSNLVRQALPASQNGRRVVGTLLGLAAMALLVVALTDVRWGKVWREVPQKGIEVMFVLDVSR